MQTRFLTESFRAILPDLSTARLLTVIAARMTAMSSAGKNAEEILKQLQMQYNSLRQSAITNEMIEITSGARALKLKKLKSRQTAKTEGGNAQ